MKILQRRGLLKAFLFAPEVIPSASLMTLSWRSSKLLVMPPEPQTQIATTTFVTFQIERTIVQAQSRKLNARWTFEVAQPVRVMHRPLPQIGDWGEVNRGARLYHASQS